MIEQSRASNANAITDGFLNSIEAQKSLSDRVRINSPGDTLGYSRRVDAVAEKMLEV